MTGRVYIPQEPMRRVGERWVPMYDLTSAREFGELAVLMARLPLDMDEVVDQIKPQLEGFNDNDYIMAVGDPAAIAIAAMIASYENAGRVKLLRWDRRMGRYLESQLDLGLRT